MFTAVVLVCVARYIFLLEYFCFPVHSIDVVVVAVDFFFWALPLSANHDICSFFGAWCMVRGSAYEGFLFVVAISDKRKTQLVERWGSAVQLVNEHHGHAFGNVAELQTCHFFEVKEMHHGKKIERSPPVLFAAGILPPSYTCATRTPEEKFR